jgi:hypothetical protein
MTQYDPMKLDQKTLVAKEVGWSAEAQPTDTSQTYL